MAVGLQDKFHRPKESEITDEAKSWVVSLACTKPKDHGLAAKLWTLSAPAQFISFTRMRRNRDSRDFPASRVTDS